MKVLIIGGTGFISTRLAAKLLQAGHEVSILRRGKSQSRLPQVKNLSHLTGDRSDEGSFRQALGKTTFDAVYDMVAYTPEESELAVRTLEGRCGRFIHCSTISVYMVSYEVQCPITEEQDKGALMDFFPRNPFGMEYGVNKRKCEAVLWNAHDEKRFPVSMLRPTYVCGPHDPVKREIFWIERILDGKPVLVPGSGDFAFQNVYVDDVAEGFVALLDKPASIGHAYNMAGEEIYSLNDYLGLICDILERQPEFVHVDQEVFDRQSFSSIPYGDVFPFNTRRTAIFSLDKIKRDLSFKTTPVREWLPTTVNWYLNEFKGHSNGYENRAEEVAFTERWWEWRSRELKQFE